MKKLTKKSLDELARTMNVIPDVENYRGGDYFYNSLGQLISTSGDGDVIWIKKNDGNLELFSDSNNRTAQTAIIRHITGHQGIIVDNLMLGIEVEKPGQYAMGRKGSTLLYNPCHGFNDHYFQVKNMYVHETVHFAGNSSERDAWAAAMADSSWAKTTPLYQGAVGGYIANAKN